MNGAAVNDEMELMEEPTEGSSQLSGRARRLLTAGVVLSSAVGLVITMGSPALANQPRGGPYAPTSSDGGQTLEGWADMVGDCTTVRCDTWLSIQRLSPGFYGIGQHWEEVAGRWISRQEGWQSISLSLADGDCGTYRTVVEDYVLTDNPDGSVSASAGVRGGGEVGVEVPVDGGSSYDRQVYASSEMQICGQRYLPADVTY